MDGLRCIDDFTLRCLDREHRAYFNTLYAGTTQVIVDLCQEGTYQSGKLYADDNTRLIETGVVSSITTWLYNRNRNDILINTSWL